MNLIFFSFYLVKCVLFHRETGTRIKYDPFGGTCGLATYCLTAENSA